MPTTGHFGPRGTCLSKLCTTSTSHQGPLCLNLKLHCYTFIGLDKMRSFQWIQCGEEALLLWQNGRGPYYCADGNSCESNGGKRQYSPVWSHQKIDYAGWPWIILNLRRYFADGVGLLPPLAQSQLLHSRPLGASPRHEGLAQSHNQDLGVARRPWVSLVIWSREMRDRMTRYDLMSIHVNKGWCTIAFSVVRNIIWILDLKNDPPTNPNGLSEKGWANQALIEINLKW